LKIERFAGVIPTLSDSSFNDTLRRAITAPSLTLIPISPYFAQKTNAKIVKIYLISKQIAIYFASTHPLYIIAQNIIYVAFSAVTIANYTQKPYLCLIIKERYGTKGIL
jgi:hypothetical protein